MTNRISTILKLFAWLITIGLCTTYCRGETTESTITVITLKSTVRLPMDTQSVTIGDLSSIQGPQADAIKDLGIDTDVFDQDGVWTKIDQARIRELIDESPNILAGSVVVRGGEVSLMIRKSPISNPNNTHAIISETTTYDGPTLQSHIEQWIYSRLRTQADTTRIRFDKRYRSILATPTLNRVVEIIEVGQSSKVHLRYAIYEQDRIIADGTLSADVQIQRAVLVAKRQIHRREIIDPNLTAIETRWLSPNAQIVNPDSSVGLESRTTIEQGQVLMQPMLVEPILVRRGQLVSAKCIIGQTIVTKVVRAKANGKLGDIIELESKDRRSQFTARIAGEGRVIIIDPAMLDRQSNHTDQSTPTHAPTPAPAQASVQALAQRGGIS
ncbi:MAG: flagellar basal body P-ring formation chaperone FlgA [Phycisphaerales bacterium]